MQHVQGEIKDILAACDGTPTQKLIAILNAAGITATAEVAALVGVSDRAVRKAKAEPQFLGTTVPPRNSSSAQLGTTVPPLARVEYNNITTNLDNKFSVVSDATPKPRQRGTRLPADWRLPKNWGEWAKANFITATDDQIRAEAERFHDFWIAKAGKDAAKLDWQATWRNWCRNSKTLTGIETGRKYNTGRMAYDERRAGDVPIKLNPHAVLHAKPLLIGGPANA